MEIKEEVKERNKGENDVKVEIKEVIAVEEKCGYKKQHKKGGREH